MSILTLTRRRLDLRTQPMPLLHPRLSETARQVFIRDNGMYPFSVLLSLGCGTHATQIVGRHGISNGLRAGSFRFCVDGSVAFYPRSLGEREANPMVVLLEDERPPFTEFSPEQRAMFDADRGFVPSAVEEGLRARGACSQIEQHSEGNRLWWFYSDGRVTLEPPPPHSPVWDHGGEQTRVVCAGLSLRYTIYNVVEKGWLHFDFPTNASYPAAEHHAVLTTEEGAQILRAAREYDPNIFAFRYGESTLIAVDEAAPVAISAQADAQPEFRMGFRAASRIIRACREGRTSDTDTRECAALLVGKKRSDLSEAHSALLDMLIDTDVLVECSRCMAIEFTECAENVEGEGLWCENCADYWSFVCNDCEERFPRSRRRLNAEGEAVCTGCVEDHYYRCGSCDELFHEDSESWQAGRGGYCASCAEEEEDDSELIQSYSTDVIRKLSWRGKKGVRYFGAEIEMEAVDVRMNALARTLMDHADGWGILKHDGSLNDGVELVTLPLTLKAWQDSKLCILHACSEAARLGARSHNTRTCGLHVHVTRDTVSEPTIAKLTMFLNDPVNETFLSKIARRSTSASYCQASKKMWKAPTPEYVELDLENDERMRLAIEHWPGDGYFNDTDASSLTKHFTYQGRDAVLRLSARTYEGLLNMKTLEKFKTRAYGDGFRITVSQLQRRGRVDNQSGRYTPLNLGNEKTIEFRLFKGTLNPETIQASVEFCDALIEWAQHASASALTAEAFMAWGETHITRKTYPSLAAYLVRRRLRTARVIPEEYRHETRTLAEPEAA